MKSKPDKTYEMELLFRALADRTRLRLINLKREDEVCVCFLVEEPKLTQPKNSRHLAYLRRVGLVAARWEGKWMHYRILAPPDARAAALFAAVGSGIAEDNEMGQDRKRLVKLCRSPTIPAPLKRAPKPVRISPADFCASENDSDATRRQRKIIP